jgi:hypothetical protein
MTNLEDLYSGPNLQVIRSRDNRMISCIKLKYIQMKLEEFNPSHIKSMTTPLEPRSILEV